MRATRSALLGILIGTIPAIAGAQTNFSLPGTANIYGAGSGTPPAPSGGGGGTLPGSYTLGSGTGRTIKFSNVTGGWGCCGPYGGTAASPDGNWSGTNINGYNNLSGVKAPSQMFLAAVFLAGGVPSSMPAALDFNSIGTGFGSLSPLLGQVFWVGDGLTGTGSGAQQVFYAPDAATEMYLGMADAFAFNGDPGWYNDNIGEIAGTFTENGNTTTTPEPASMALMATGLAGMAAVARRKRRNS